MTKHTSHKKALVILGILILVAILTALVRHQLAKTHFNKDFVNGNTPGNLYNAGLFCENGDTIFFSNPSDNHRLYSMSTDGSNLKKLCNDTASYINADAHYVYYVRNNVSDGTAFSFLKWNSNSLCRIKRTGGEVTILDKDPSLYSSLVGNYVYYIHYDTSEASTLYRVRIDGEERQQIHPSPILPCATSGPYIYYNGIDHDHAIYRMDTQSNVSSAVYDGNCQSPIVVGNTAYFLDCDNNYALKAADLTTGEAVTLTTDRVDCFNIAGNYIYYQRSSKSNPALCRISTAGGEPEEILSGIYTDINVVLNRVYFYSFGNDTSCYVTPADGAVSVTPFQPK